MYVYMECPNIMGYILGLYRNMEKTMEPIGITLGLYRGYHRIAIYPIFYILNRDYTLNLQS